METRGAPNVARKRPIMIARMLNDTQCSVCRVRAPSRPVGLARPNTHTHTNTHIHTHIHTYIHAYIHTHACMCSHMQS